MSKCVICGHEAIGYSFFCDVCDKANEDLKTAKEVTRACEACGATFTYMQFSKTPRRYCAACIVERKREQHRRSDAKRRPPKAPTDVKVTHQPAGSQFQAMSPAQVRQQATKPRGMSDVRWRIELRRRRNPGYYAGCDIQERIR